MLKSRGFTLIELMTVIVIAAILMAIAAPSFKDFLAKKRVEGVLTELATDLQFARSEAVQRNANVRVTFGTGCYVIHTVGSTATSCTQSGGASPGTGAVEIKTVKLDAGSTVSFSPNESLTYVMFDSVRAMASWDGTNEQADGEEDTGSINVNSSVGAWQLRASINPMGRTKTCSPDGSVSGYSSTAC